MSFLKVTVTFLGMSYKPVRTYSNVTNTYRNLQVTFPVMLYSRFLQHTKTTIKLIVHDYLAVVKIAIRI